MMGKINSSIVLLIVILPIALTTDVIHSQLPEPIQNFVEYDNRIFVGAGSKLYKLYFNLTIEESVRLTEESECSNEKKVQVLELFNNRLLVCTTQRCGLCSFYDFSLNLLQHLSDKKRDRWQILSGKKSTQIITESEEDNKIVVMKSLESTKSLSLPYLSYLELKDGHFSQISSIQLKTDTNLSKSFPEIDVITSYEYKGQMFFVIVVTDNNGEVFTKVVRWCQNMGIAGYTEIIVTCSGKISTPTTTSNVVYNKAVSAFFGKVASEDEKAIFLTMTEFKRFSNPVVLKSYSICAFRMEEIREKMTNVQSNCYRNGVLSTRPYWLVGVDYETCQSTMDQQKILSDIYEQRSSFCGHKANGGVGPKKLDTEILPMKIGKSQTQITSRFPPIVASYNYELKTLAIVVTIEGEIYRILCDFRKKAYGTALMMSSMAETSTLQPYFSGIIIDSSQKFAFVAESDSSSGFGRLMRFKTTSCNTETNRNSCQNCLSDPICGWCGTRCSTEKSCTNGQWSSQTCQPVINEVSPLDGPISGGTILTLKGSFTSKHDTHDIKIFIGDVPCKVVSVNRRTINCKTPKTPSPFAGQILLSLNEGDDNPSSLVSGSAKYHEKFQYKRLDIISIKPNASSIAHSNDKNIQIETNIQGSDRRIQICDEECKIQMINNEMLTCKIPPIKAITKCNVKLIVDDGLVNRKDGFSYVKEPVIFGVKPNITASNIVFPFQLLGNNLNYLGDNISLITSVNDQKLISICEKASLDGTSIECFNSKLDVTDETDAVIYVKEIPINLIIKDSLKITYQTFPKFKKPQFKDNKIVFSFDNSELPMSYKDSIRISIDGRICQNVYIALTEMICTYPNVTSDVPILLQIGDESQLFSSKETQLIFYKERWKILLYIIVGILGFAICAGTIVFIVKKKKDNKRRKLKSKDDCDFTKVPSDEYIGKINDSFARHCNLFSFN
ncbi:DgyrCDS2732 [Dimorphilus gyrociliatus]|uniref:DgyrCDS2732 n=1 Tax=Dimorphilus gyrociliatus TaxID=2664684 RepID=A0A7I8VG97_9ANNE|nr:DgyrCDS2732 [Dimorphilus gyrociliatus]